MKRTEREQLIERYLEGSLTPAEEQEFFIEVATDREMQYDLKASQVVESAIRKDRERAPDSWGETRTELTAILTAQRGVQTEREVDRDGGAHIPWRSSWIVTAVVLLLVSFTALLVSLVAIDRTTPEQVRTTPLSTPESEQTIGEQANVPDQPEALKVEEDSRSLKSVENARGEGAKQSLPPLHGETEKQVQAQQNPPHDVNPKESISTDTTNPDGKMSIDFESN